MERMQQALERAKAARRGASGPATPTRMEPVGPAAELTKAPGEAIEAALSRARSVSVTQGQLEQSRLVAHRARDAYADVYRMLRTQVLRRLSSEQSAIGVTSPQPGEGKTLTACNMALAMARESSRAVVLVDLDLRHPSVHEVFGFTPVAGIGDYLSGRAEFEDCVVDPGVGGLRIISGRAAHENSSELIAGARMGQLATQLRQPDAGRIVIFDLPPVLAADDVVVFAPQLDGTLLLVREGFTTREALERALELLGDTPLLGTVLNGCSEAELKSYYY